MDNTPPIIAAEQAADESSHSPDRWTAELGVLLEQLDAVAGADQALPPVLSRTADDFVVHRRLGIAGSLFAALQCKHAATAGHSLRVALTCSAWAARMNMQPGAREILEIAALLHDIGIIGVPDHILLKPGRLDEDETPPDDAGAADEPRDSPPELHVAGDPRDRGEHPGLVRRQRGTACLAGATRSRGCPHDRHRRGLRRHDHRPRLPPGDVAGAGDGRVVRVCRHAVRSGAGQAVRRVPRRSQPADRTGRWPAAGSTRSIPSWPIPTGS